MPTLPSKTINATSFAVGYNDAHILVLDAIVLDGDDRLAKFKAAKRRLGDAMGFADSDEEVVLVSQLVNYIKYVEQRHLRELKIG